MSAFASVALIAVAAPASAESVADWRPLVTQAAQRCAIPSDWIERVMQAESAGRTTLAGRPIVSRAGAMGLMQLMPRTWAMLRARLGLGSDPFDPRDNILAGACYLRLLHDRFGYPGMFAAYNAGPGRYDDVLRGRQGLPSETIGYLAALAAPRLPVVAAGGVQAPPPTLFAKLGRETVAAGDAPSTPTPDPLFFVRIAR